MSIHKSVLLEETVCYLNIGEGSIVVDATLGGGGHGREIVKRISGNGKYVGIDADPEAVKNFLKFPVSALPFSNKFQIPVFKYENLFIVNDNFSNLERILEALEIKKVDAIMADLGWSSDQLSGKGMSFSKNEELDMRLSRNQEVSAKEIVNNWEENEIERILREYGEEKFSRKIAKEIVASRKENPIETTFDLSEIVEKAVPKSKQSKKINVATRTFQALRIEVNQELNNLKVFIPKAIEALKPGGRIAIISFHSLEDRIVKNIFRDYARGCICPADFPVCRCGKNPEIRIITKKPAEPKEKELGSNPRARSARLRVAEKL